ncbi:hypothetical protein ACSFA8_24640 [Variovorax sp. RT4R15]|uniref:hypothetical protein n=1 Tax=Variovorax sp. RT4R15 TaxID=3443737 RepID=UPI003F472539
MRDRESVSRRREQISNIKTTLEAASAIMVMQRKVADENNIKKSDVKEGEGNVVALFKQAGKFM